MWRFAIQNKKGKKSLLKEVNSTFTLDPQCIVQNKFTIEFMCYTSFENDIKISLSWITLLKSP